MASLRLIDVLPDFGAGFDTPSPAIADLSVSAVGHPGVAFAAAVDVEESLRQAVAEAEAAIGSRLTEQFEVERRAEQERQALALATQARALGEDAARAISSALADMEERLVDHFGTAVARIVGGVMSDDLRKRSVDALAAAIRNAVADREAVRMAVRGPQFLYESLAEKLPERSGGIDFVESDGFDLTVLIDGTLLETRLGEWAAMLSEVLS